MSAFCRRSHSTVTCDFAAVYSPRWAFLNQQQPVHTLLAEGSAIAVYSGQPLT